ncbi:MAG: hypothetical protein JWO31_1088 [Phycisphaerales bacterium]|nr:hypothetical protein [Phycisphaerales bacterium]
MAGIPIGKLLVEQGVLTREQVKHILEVQRSSHRPFGDLAERLYGVEPRAIEDAWTQQYVSRTGATDLETVAVDPACLKLITARQAWQFHLLPLFRDDDSVHVATTADNLVRGVNFVTRKFGEPAHFVIASDRQLRQHLMRHYPVPQYVADYAMAMA